MPLEPGQELGSYRIDGLLGVGGMGEVYRATDRKLGRAIALKVLLPDATTDSERRLRFEREARSVAALNHPNIVTLYSVEEAEGLHFLTMELIEGQTLDERLPTGGMTFDQLMQIAIPLADAVAAAHAQGVIHRDLKPGNVMVARDERVKVLDFGLAKLRPASAVPDRTTASVPMLTDDRTVMGTVSYMSPEQAENREIDQRSDLFSFGVMLYELATGRKPFRGESSLAVLSSILRDTPKPVVEMRPDLPRQIDRVIRRCLAKDVSQRYQSAVDLRNELEDIKQDVAISGTAPPREQSGTMPRGLKAVAWLGSTAVVAAGVFSYLVWRGTIDFGFRQSTSVMASPVKFTIAPPESVKSIQALAVSRDGTQVAFSGANRLWVHTLATKVTRLVDGVQQGGAAPLHPFWSPDGQFLAYFQGERLLKIPAAGGIPQMICEVDQGRGGSWNTENTIIYAGIRKPINRVDAAGGTPTALTTLSKERNEEAHLWPHFLPDGRHFTYIANPTGTIYVGSLDTGEPSRKILTEDSRAFALSGFLLTADSGVLRARPFAVDRAEISGEPQPLDMNVGRWMQVTGARLFAASPAVLAYVEAEPRRHQFLVTDGGTSELGIGSPVFMDTFSLWGAIPWTVSPDGTKVAFAQRDSTDPTRLQVALLDIANGTSQLLTASRSGGTLPHWSKSGDQILFSRAGQLYGADLKSNTAFPIGPANPNEIVAHDSLEDGTVLAGLHDPASNNANLFLLRPGSDSQWKPWLPPTATYGLGRFSPDGKWVAYSSTESGRAEVFVRRFPEGDDRQQISSSGGNSVRWAGGNRLFYRAPDRTLMEVALDVGQTIKPGVPRPRFKVDRSVGYAVLPDGKRFVLCRPVEAASPPTITVVLNWAAGLKRN